MAAVTCPTAECLSVLLNQPGIQPDCRNKMETTALMFAAQQRKLEHCRALIDHHANILTKDQHGRDALMYAANGVKDMADVVHYLLDHHAHINSRDAQEYTPLMWAAEAGHVNIVSFLVSNHKRQDAHGRLCEKCDLNAKNCYGGTALMIAINGGHTETVVTLLDSSSKEDQILLTQNKDGWTPFLVAAHKGLAGSLVKMRLYMQRMYTNQMNDRIISHRTKDGRDALLCCVQSGQAPAVQALLDRCGYILDASTMMRPETQEAIKLAKSMHDTTILNVLKVYVDIADNRTLSDRGRSTI